MPSQTTFSTIASVFVWVLATALLLATSLVIAQPVATGSACAVTYHALGGQTDSGERVRAEDLEGASIYFLDIDNWPGQDKLSTLSLTGGGIIAESQFHGGKATIIFPEGRHKVTVVVVQNSKRYWGFHDRKALPFFDKPPLHEFSCALGKISR